MEMRELDKYLISPNSTVVEAMRKIDSNSKGILFVVNDINRLLGVVTDGDIRRWLIRTGQLKSPIRYMMNINPITILQNESSFAVRLMEKKSITAIPVVDKDFYVQRIIFLNSKTKSKNYGEGLLEKVPVVIMAGGRGTRLYPYTKILPKPLIPIGDIPIMERIISKFRDADVKVFYATVNYRKGMIKSYFNDMTKDYTINYVEEDKPLGTAGSLKLLPKRFDKPFIVTNCDILINADYNDIYKYHMDSGNELTIVSALKNIVVPYGVIHSSENGAVESMEEKPKLSYFVNTGMYILNPNLVDDIPKDEFFHMTHLADKLMKEGRRVGMYPISEDSFLDMGEFEEMHRMEEKLNLKS